MGLPIISPLVQQYEEAFPHADHRTRNWFLLWDSPVYVWALSLAYLAFVWLGPKAMANREPFKLQTFLVVYNMALVVLSVYMAVEMVLSTYNAGYNYICDPYSAEAIKNPAELRVANVFWWYFISKAIELLDTVLMIVRKKNNQVTFLHVYHHVSMLNIWWWVMMFIPGGLSWFGAWVNTIVHVIMYLYYGLSAIPSLREKLWWKKYLTRFQLIQFCINLSHTVAMFFTSCAFPLWGKLLLVGYMITMLILFSNFYIQTYKKRSQLAKSTKSVTNGSSSTNNEILANGFAKLNGHTNGHTNGSTNGIVKRHVAVSNGKHKE